MLSDRVWAALDALVDGSTIEIDRPRGSRHPRRPDIVYPLDYGFLERTTAGDGDGVDVWLGSDGARDLRGVLLAVDTLKRDVELKLLLGCSDTEMKIALDVTNTGDQTAQLFTRST